MKKKVRTKSREFREELANAIMECNGCLTPACRKLNISYSSLKTGMAENAEFASFIQDTIAECKTGLLDKAKMNLNAKLDEGDWKSTEFTLKTLGKDEFSEKHDVQISGDLVIKWGSE